jgi:hypothetical protein
MECKAALLRPVSIVEPEDDYLATDLGRSTMKHQGDTQALMSGILSY